MRHKSLHSIWFLLLIVALYIPSSFSQTSFTMTLANDNLDLTGKVYSVDIMFLSRDVAPVELAALSMGFAYNDLARNGGTITASWVAGSSSGLTNSTQIPGLPNMGATTVVNSITYRILKIASKPNPGAGNGSQLSNVAPGTRIGRLVLTNTVAWAITGPNSINWEFVAYPTTVNAYVAGINTLIGGKGTANTDSTWFAKTLTGPVLPVELTSFQSNVQGRSVVLSWSTSTEKNSDRFEIQRAAKSGASFTTVSSVKASVLSNSTKEYSYSDNKLQSGKYQYRLKMIDNDGSFSYSKVTETEVAVPKDFQVSQNYPNPFNPTTKIDYQVPVDAKVILEVYNIAGQKVVELVNQEQSAGYYTANFGSTKLSTGVYIYRLVASDKVTGNNFSSIKKMMMLK